jgi:glucosamine kinase
MQRILAIDAGGTTTRAVIVDLSGRCLGYGQAGGGNPISAGVDSALASLVAATTMALQASQPATDTFSSALIAMAGASAQMPLERISDRFTSLGLRGDVEVDSDLLAMFYSGTSSSHGYTLVAGTGAAAARITDGRLEAVSGGSGWLLGDAGSGYWIGHQVVRAVVASLDGRAPETALSDLLVASLQLEATSERSNGRSLLLLRLIHALYALRPIELSRFAPLAFQAQDDHVASGILAAAASELAGTLAAVWDPGMDGPVVLGGSVLGGTIRGNGMLAGTSPLAASLKTALGDAELIPVRDGVVGAAVLGLLRAGIRLDRDVFFRIGRNVSLRREAASVNGSVV